MLSQHKRVGAQRSRSQSGVTLSNAKVKLAGSMRNKWESGM